MAPPSGARPPSGQPDTGGSAAAVEAVGAQREAGLESLCDVDLAQQQRLLDEFQRLQRLRQSVAKQSQAKRQRVQRRRAAAGKAGGAAGTQG